MDLKNLHLNLNASFLFASIVWGAVGFGFSLYGWREKDMIPLFGGIAMMVASYFVGSALFMSLACIALIVAVVWLKKHV